MHRHDGEGRNHLVTAFALRGRGVEDRDRDLELLNFLSGLVLLLSSLLLLRKGTCLWDRLLIWMLRQMRRAVKGISPIW